MQETLAKNATHFRNAISAKLKQEKVYLFAARHDPVVSSLASWLHIVDGTSSFVYSSVVCIRLMLRTLQVTQVQVQGYSASPIVHLRLPLASASDRSEVNCLPTHSRTDAPTCYFPSMAHAAPA